MDREASLFGSTCLETDSPGLRASLTCWFGLIALDSSNLACMASCAWNWHGYLYGLFPTGPSQAVDGVWLGCMHVLRRKEKDFEEFLLMGTDF